MKVMPIRYVADVAVSARFYAALGLIPGDSSRSGNWTELNGSGGMLALHAARAAEQDRPGRIELSFETQGAVRGPRRAAYRGRLRAGGDRG